MRGAPPATRTGQTTTSTPKGRPMLSDPAKVAGLIALGAVAYLIATNRSFASVRLG